MEAVLPKIAEMQKQVWIKKERKKRHKRLVTELLIDYAKNSTLHGLRYTSERSLTMFERVFWVLTFFTSIILCGYHISNVCDKWNTSPVIVTVGERMISAGSIPVPAITICPQVKCKASVYKYEQRYKAANTLNLTDLEEFTDIRMLCGTRRKKTESRSKRVTNLTVIDRINKVSPTIEETLFPCTYNKCNFTNTYTSEGLCFTYNNLAASEVFREGVWSSMESARPSRGWSPDTGYNQFVRDAYPERSRLKQTVPHMVIRLHSDSADEDPLCNSMITGYKLYLSHPADVPRASVYYYAALNDQRTSLAISATIFRSSKSLKKYSVEKRQCYFSDEKQLRYFKIYTFSNCQLECLTNYTMQVCGCVAFYMPRPLTGAPVCSPLVNPCLIKSQRLMAQRELQAEEDASVHTCRCLPLCDSIQYDAEVLKTDYRKTDYLRNLSKVSESTDFITTEYLEKLSKYNKNTTKYSGVIMYFKQPYFVAMQRSEMFGITDFFANIGGLLGVFLGFSFLSLVEIFYFIFIRIGFTIKRDLDDEKK